MDSVLGQAGSSWGVVSFCRNIRLGPNKTAFHGFMRRVMGIIRSSHSSQERAMPHRADFFAAIEGSILEGNSERSGN